MRKKIQQLAKGNIDYEMPRLQIVTPPVTETVLLGTVFRGAVSVRSANELPFRGLLYAEDNRIEIPNNAFGGTETTIEYIFHAEQFEESSEIKGQFSFVTSGGNLSLPYSFRVSVPELAEEDLPDTVKALGELYQTQPATVQRLFDSERFLRSGIFRDDSLRALYEGLRRGPDRKLALEEFLVACGAKPAVTLTVDDTPQTYHFNEDMPQGEFYMARSTEGYVLSYIRSEAAFLRLPKERWNSGDFTGNTCRVTFTILKKELHEGKNTGIITVNSGRGVTRIPVTVIRDRADTLEERREKQYRRSRLQLMRAMVPLYASDVPERGVAAQVLKHLDACDAFRDPDARARLLRAEILRQLGRTMEEKQVLEEIRASVQRARSDDPLAYIWFLYLEEEIEKGSRQSDAFLRLLYRMREEDKNRPELFPLIYRCDLEWSADPARVFERIRRYSDGGEENLLMMVHACRLFAEHPEYAGETDSFLRRLFRFGAENELWDEETARWIAERIGRSEEYCPSYFAVLKKFIGLFGDRFYLETLLALLIRGKKDSAAFHSWYVRGISADVQLPELYEYYLRSMPAGGREDIPQIVLLYYTYNSPAGETACRNLYQYILKNFPEDERLYRLYEKQMQQFARDELLAGRFDDVTAQMFERMFIPEVLEEKTAGMLIEPLFSEHLILANPDIVRVLMEYGELREEMSYPVENGEVFVPVYVKNCRPLFEDSQGNRFARTGLKRRRMLNAGEGVFEKCRELKPGALPFRLSNLQRAMAAGAQSTAQQLLIRGEMDWELLNDVYRRKMVLTLIRAHNSDTPETRSLYRNLADSPYLDDRSGKLLTESFIRTEDDEAALEMMHRFGFRSFKPELLMKLLTRQVRRIAYAYSAELTELALALYREGVHNDVTLTYLCRYHNGSTEEMLRLLEKAGNSRAVLYDLPERLLGQLLFTGEYERLEPVYELYVKEENNRDRQLVHAYLVVQSDRFFRGQGPLSETVIRDILSWLEQEKKADYLPVICLLALLKCYAGREKLTAEETLSAEKILTYLYEHGYLFAFEKKLGRFFPLPAELADKMILEYEGDAEGTVEIGIRLLPDEEGQEMNFSEMPHSYGGIYVKPVLLFAGEVLEYTIVQVENGRRRVLTEGRLCWEMQEQLTQNRFTKLNEIVRQAGDGSDPAWQKRVAEYGVNDVLLREYFNV